MTRTLSLPCYLLLAILASLLNSSVLGNPSLTAYFGFSVCATLFALLVFLSTTLYKPIIKAPVPIHLLIFLGLSTCMFIHGIVTGTTNLVHYYWITCALWLLACSTFRNQPDHSRYYPLITIGIFMISCLESLIVWLQWTNILPSKDPLFPCTGTWVNPNVTAMFLAMSLFAALRLSSARGKGHTPGKNLVYAGLLLIITAITLLQCRSALLVSVILIVSHYSAAIRKYLTKRSGAAKALLLLSTALFVFFLMGLLTFKFKPASSEGRIDIWKNSLHLIANRPLTGFGFGMFEKEYNLFVAGKGLPSRGHVNMAYNDFIELGAEGGLIAPLIWAFFILALIRYNVRRYIPLAPVLSFLAIELTNFGFQAIPVFILFLLYTGLDGLKTEIAMTGPALNRRPIAIPGLIVAATCLFYQISLAHSFYQRASITRDMDPIDAVDAYRGLNGTLRGFQSFHEAYGDAFLHLQRYDSALQQYLLAARWSSLPAVLTKCGYCYQQKQVYEKGEYYYELVQNMQPAQFAPRMSLLNLYRLKGDSAKMYAKAQEIVNMPVKTENDQAETIIAYARKVVDTKRQNNR